MLYKRLLLSALPLLIYAQGQAMCGAMISFEPILIVNESSRVIMVRDGNHTIVTMTNDFKGAPQNFAMIVPVPEVLSRKDIRVIRPAIFERLDNLTAPYLETLYDPEPNCPEVDGLASGNDFLEEVTVTATRNASPVTTGAADNRLKVRVNARYQVEEYDIVILSAKDSDGLRQWLALNGYNLPPGATEALLPYIESGMKFFVVKVNLDHLNQERLMNPQQQQFTNLRPLQIQFDSPKFMLPIRLGMANAVSAQDLIVYAFTKSGRVETTNYRTQNIPSNREIPHVLSSNGQFDSFYRAVFDKAWREAGRNDVFLEYASVLNGGRNAAPEQLNLAELKEAGVWWLDKTNEGAYQGDLHLTRLHVRYTRDKFPQDLSFMQTPNKATFHSKYVVRMPARGPFDCARGQSYLDELQVRFRNEVAELAALTDWNPNTYQYYIASVPGRSTSPVRQPQPIPAILPPSKKKPTSTAKKVKNTLPPKAPVANPDTVQPAEPAPVQDSIAPAVNDTIPPEMTTPLRKQAFPPEPEAPKNEGGSDPILWIAALLLSFSLIVLGLVLYRRRKHQS